MSSNIVKRSILLAVALVVVCGASPARAQEWGSIKGRIVVDGTAPKPAPIAVTKDQFCMDKKPESDSLVIGKDNSLVNAVVYLRVGTGGPKVAINPEYEAKFKEPVTLDNKGCMFHPHITVVRVGQTLDVTSSDPVGHNTNIALLSFNQTIPSNGPPTPIKVTQSGAIPMPVVCNIHPWMKGYILAIDHPYAAVTGDDGTFEIKDIPAGQHEFQFWHESGYLKNVALKGATTDNRGRAKLKIEAGKTLDLGDIKVKASGLKP
jgi:plastocyanin